MAWIVLDVGIGLLAVALLVGVGLGVWRRVKALSGELARAGEVVGGLTAALSELQPGPRTSPAGHSSDPAAPRSRA